MPPVSVCVCVQDDAWVQKFAELLRDTLRPDVKVYVEYANEVWNQGFPVYQYTVARGLALGLSTVASTASIRYHALRSTQVFNIVAGVFGASNRARLVHVMATWSFLCNADLRGCGYPYTQELLSWNNTYMQVDALGLTGYFCDDLGTSRVSQAATMSPVRCK